MDLVIFDIDGTLTDTNIVDGECYWRAVGEVLGISGEQPEWSDFRHVTDVGIAAELCSRYLGRELSDADIETIGARLTMLLDPELARKNSSAHQIPGAAEILSLLSKSSAIAIALTTGGLRVSAELKLRRARLPFAQLPFASSNDALSREDILRISAARAAEKHGTQFVRITYVGDGTWDAKAAHELGWRFIGIASGPQAARLRQAGATIIVPDYQHADAFLKLLSE